MKSRLLSCRLEAVFAFAIVVGVYLYPIGLGWAGICDMPPEYSMFPPNCCEIDSDCDIPGIWQGTCAPAAIGYCNTFAWDWLVGIYYWVCASDGECPGAGSLGQPWCLTEGQCYNANGQPTGRKCVVGADPSIYMCAVGGGMNWGYVICDDYHPCEECCAMGWCGSWSSAFCDDDEFEQCLPCTCIDSDNDGYGTSPVSPSCDHSEPDCDDTNPAVHPGAVEECGAATCSDGLDNDCNGLADSEDPACKQWCAKQAQGATVGAIGIAGHHTIPGALALLTFPVIAILMWKLLARKKLV